MRLDLNMLGCLSNLRPIDDGRLREHLLSFRKFLFLAKMDSNPYSLKAMTFACLLSLSPSLESKTEASERHELK
ncbi:MAG: hypothetical protein VX855_02015, partial [Verrucomicrobiota bacterium]|nr:hypothetical protein [Verrucomicrobiota bacterium]